MYASIYIYIYICMYICIRTSLYMYTICVWNGSMSGPHAQLHVAGRSLTAVWLACPKCARNQNYLPCCYLDMLRKQTASLAANDRREGFPNKTAHTNKVAACIPLASLSGHGFLPTVRHAVCRQTFVSFHVWLRFIIHSDVCDFRWEASRDN